LGHACCGSSARVKAAIERFIGLLLVAFAVRLVTVHRAPATASARSPPASTWGATIQTAPSEQARPVLAKALATGDDWAVTWSANIMGAILTNRGDLVGALAH
jgi:hypothetical protein